MSSRSPAEGEIPALNRMLGDASDKTKNSISKLSKGSIRTNSAKRLKKGKTSEPRDDNGEM